jgi:hypothetical protein
MAEVTEMKSAVELNAQKPPPFVASQSGAVEKAPTANEEEMIRAMFQQAAAQGNDNDLHVTVTLPQAPAPGPEQPPSAPAPAVVVPQKFQKPDGTVDEDKLKASSERLNEAVEQKQKTVDELLLEYQEREKKLHGLGQQKAEIERQMSPVLAPVVPIQDPQALQQRILQDYQQNPLDTVIKLSEAIAETKLAPFRDRFQQEDEQRRLQGMRQNVADLAQADPRFLDPRLNAMVNQVLDEEPGMMRLKNPHKAAWNEVKERLRLGEPNQVPAQPSSAMPTLGRGAPPSVSALPGPITPQTAFQQAQQVNPYSPEGKAFEEQLKEMTRGLWQQ